MKTVPLYPYQGRVNEFTERRARVGIFSFYGSGKSYLSLKWLESLHLQGRKPLPCLILTMKSLVHQWGCEIKKHTGLSCALVTGDAEKRVNALRRDVKLYVINYDAIRSIPVRKALASKTFRSVIADESTMLKTSRTVRFKELRKFTKRIPFRALLTGRPILERPEDIWSQLLFLDDGATFGSSFWRFRYTYFTPGPPWDPYAWYLKNGAGKEIASRLGIKCIQIKKEVVAAELPPKVYNKVEFVMPEKTRKLYKTLKKEFQIELPSGKQFETKWAMVKSAKLHQLCQGFMYIGKNGDYEKLNDTKLCWLEENLPLMLENGPVLLWVNFKALLERVSQRLINTGIPHVILSSKMSPAQRAEGVRKFQSGDVDVLLLSQQVGATGLNLQRANQAVFISTDYKAALRENAEDRCHRVGSEVHEYVTYYDLVMSNSIDGVVLHAIKHKLDVAEQILQYIRSE